MKRRFLTICIIVFVISQELAAQPANRSQASMPPEASVASIRNVNFGNFTYPWPKDLIDPESMTKTFRLKNGALPITRDKYGDINGGGSLTKVTYGDVTGDGIEEAMIWIKLVTGGTSHPDLFYIYTMQDNRLKLLWHLQTGDRAVGGMRRAYARRGNLVVELFGPGSEGNCCATEYTRTVYEWRGNRFRPIQKQTFPIQQPN